MGKGKKDKSNHGRSKINRGGLPKKNNDDSSKKTTARRKKKHEQYMPNTHEDSILRESIESDGTRTVLDMESDGNCLFRSIADQLYYDHGAKHADVRHEICDYLQQHEEFFSLFLDLDDDETKGQDAADFDEYVRFMREDGEWGGNLELVAAARLYRRRISVFSSQLAVMNIDYDSDKLPPSGPDLLLSYHGSEHYNSIRDSKRGTKPPPPPQGTYVKADDSIEPEEYPSDEATTEATTDSNPPSLTSNSESSSETNGEQNNHVDPTDNAALKSTAKKTPPPPKGTAPCPCGSRLKYKKCCKEKDRREARLQRVLQQKRLEVSDDDEDDEANAAVPMEGKFRILSI